MIGAYRVLGVVPQSDDLTKSNQDRGVVSQARDRAASLPVALRPTVLVAVDANGVRGLLNLPRRDIHALADFGQEQVQGLIEGVPAVSLGKEEELADRAHDIGQVLGERQVLVLQERGVLIQDSLKVFAAHGYKRATVLYAASDNIGFPA